jgi:hypothetical protein
MKPTGRTDKPEQNPSTEIVGHSQKVGWISRKNLHSGRGRSFFLTSLFIELIEGITSIGIATAQGANSRLSFLKKEGQG